MALNTSVQGVVLSPRSGRPRRAGWLLVAGIAIVSLAAGIAGTLGYQHLRWLTGASSTNAQAARLDSGLSRQLSTMVFSEGNFVGHANTEGDLVNLVEGYGGIVLSFAEDRQDNVVADVMLGLMPAGGGVQAAGYPVRCYSYSFGVLVSSIHHSDLPCPASRTDGQPGSVAAQMGWLLAIGPVHPGPSQASYQLNLLGADEFLAHSFIEGVRLSPAPVLASRASGDVFAAAFQRDGACFFLRMSSQSDAPANEIGGPPADDLDDLWLAPANDQAAGFCTGGQALAASGLYGTDPS
jgi:hypothetical protein